jgi:hypothetical protein
MSVAWCRSCLEHDAMPDWVASVHVGLLMAVTEDRRIALDAFNAHDASEPPEGELPEWWERYDALLLRVGECFALDTADRNRPETAVDASLDFIRAVVAW